MKSFDKTIKILDALVETGGARVSELSDLLDIPDSTVHKHLKSLKKHGFVQSKGDINTIGLKFLYYSGYKINNNEIYSIIQPKVEYLAERTGERCQFVTEQNGEGVYLFTKLTDESAIQADVRPGKYVDLHATAAGKTILAHLPRSRVNEIITDRELSSHTPKTITQQEALYDELDQIREQGYGINDEERITKQRAVGVPVLNTVGRPIGAFSVSGPANRLNSKKIHEELPELLMGTVDEVELDIEYNIN